MLRPQPFKSVGLPWPDLGPGPFKSLPSDPTPNPKTSAPGVYTALPCRRVVEWDFHSTWQHVGLSSFGFRCSFK